MNEQDNDSADREIEDRRAALDAAEERASRRQSRVAWGFWPLSAPPQRVVSERGRASPPPNVDCHGICQCGCGKHHLALGDKPPHGGAWEW